MEHNRKRKEPLASNSSTGYVWVLCDTQMSSHDFPTGTSFYSLRILGRVTVRTGVKLAALAELIRTQIWNWEDTKDILGSNINRDGGRLAWGRALVWIQSQWGENGPSPKPRHKRVRPQVHRLVRNPSQMLDVCSEQWAEVAAGRCGKTGYSFPLEDSSTSGWRQGPDGGWRQP